jgi:hypothetical protein
VQAYQSIGLERENLWYPTEHWRRWSVFLLIKMKIMKNIKNLKDQQLQRISGMWLVRSTELQWKANKLKARLQKRLEREAKRHASLKPTHNLLATAKIVLEALLPHGESEAVELVRAQITEFETKIQDVAYRYNLLSDEEIALKYMDLELAEMKATMARAALVEVEAELLSRVVAIELVEAIEKEASVSEGLTVSKARSIATSKKVALELRILKTLRQGASGFGKLRRARTISLPSQNGVLLSRFSQRNRPESVGTSF